MKAAQVAAAASALAAAICLAQPAAAWCRATTCNPAAEPCEVQDGCIVTGFPQFWGSRCVSFAVQQAGTPLRAIPYEVAIEVISDGYRAWMNADCGGGVPPLIEIATQGAAICDQHVYNQDGPNANVWMFRDDEWPYDSVPGAAFALTTVTFNVETGEIFDADVEINSVQNELSLDPTLDPSVVTNDLPSIVTHEAGHFLGLSHSSVEEATMFTTYAAGSIELRTLAADDMAAICAAYPPDRQPSTDSCEPRHGFVSECAAPEPPPDPDPPPAGGSAGSENASDGSEPKPVTCGCTIPGRAGEQGLIPIAVLAMTSLMFRRRVRRWARAMPMALVRSRAAPPSGAAPARAASRDRARGRRGWSLCARSSGYGRIRPGSC